MTQQQTQLSTMRHFSGETITPEEYDESFGSFADSDGSIKPLTRRRIDEHIDKKLLGELSDVLRNPKSSPKEVGISGELVARVMLEARGMRVLEHNFRTRYGEIDLICAEGKNLVFVEVKTRRSTLFGTPAEAVTPAKQRKIRLACVEWLHLHGSSFPGHIPRFDVVAIEVKNNVVHSRHIMEAF